MLVTEIIVLNNKKYRHNYSNEGYYIIRNDGEKYRDAIDILESTYTYTESDEKIPEPQPEEDKTKGEQE